MDNRLKEEDSRSELSLTESIRLIAARNARAPLDNDKQLLLFLQSWWSNTYNRPLKDPLLLSYTLEELLYEFYDKIERVKAEKERIEQDGDKIDEEKEKAALDWAEAEEKRDLEREAQGLKGEDQSKPISDPTKDPDNIAWMEKQIQEAKAQYGDDFGEDLDLNFE